MCEVGENECDDSVIRLGKLTRQGGGDQGTLVKHAMQFEVKVLYN